MGKMLTGAVSLVRALGLVIVAILVLDIVLAVLSANLTSGIARFFRAAAGTVSLGTDGLFLASNPALALGINHGVAAVCWLAMTGIVVTLLRRAGSA